MVKTGKTYFMNGKKDTYNFHQFEKISSFARDTFTSITTGKDQVELSIEITALKKKTKPKSFEKKNKKRYY